MTSNHFSWGHLLTTILGIAVTALSPTVQGLIGAHPLVSTILYSVWSILGVFLNPPGAPKAGVSQFTRLWLMCVVLPCLWFCIVYIHRVWLG